MACSTNINDLEQEFAQNLIQGQGTDMTQFGKPAGLRLAVKDENLVPLQERQQFQKMRNPFCMTLKTFPVHKHPRLVRQPGMSYKTRSGGSTFNPMPTLELLRGTLQHRINKDIQKVFQQYAHFFQMAVENIQDNNGKDSVTEHHVLSVFRNSLEEAKSVFHSHKKHVLDSVENADCNKNVDLFHFDHRESAWSDEDQLSKAQNSKTEYGVSEAATFSLRPTPQIQTRKRKGRPPLHHRDYTDEIPLAGGGYKSSKPRLELIKKEGPKWDPARLTTGSKFVMGARANKALGLGNTRGRLYIKHPDLFKYSGDQDDKLWLYEHHLMPATGGKAYMLLLEDILELAQTEEYKDNHLLNTTELKVFEVPDFILDKIKHYMETNRTDGNTQVPSSCS